MKALNIAFALLVFTNSTKALASPMQNANMAVQESHVAARKLAKSVFEYDLTNLMQELIFQQKKNSQLESWEPIQQKIADLNLKIVTQLDKAQNLSIIDENLFEELIQNYRELVLLRFQLSYKAQDIELQKHQLLRSFLSPIEGMYGMCEVGHSFVGAIAKDGELGTAPKNNFAVQFSYQVNTDGSGGSPTTMSFGTQGFSSQSQDRNNTSAVMGTAASLSWSIGMSGATGASTSMAMAAAPYLTGAFVAYALIAYTASNDEAASYQSELTKAKTHVFVASANDRDVARYYSEECQFVKARLDGVYKLAKSFAESENSREELMKRILETKEYRIVFNNELAAAINSNEENPQNVFSKGKYTQEQIMEYIFLNAFEVLFEQWEELSVQIQSVNFDNTDRLIKSLNEKLHTLMYEIRQIRESKWSVETDLVGINSELDREFSNLRSEYFQIINETIKANLGKGSLTDSEAHFQAFLIKFKKFSSKTMLNKDVQEMSKSVQRLKAFYEKK